jgi:hypothetical protein
MPGYLGAIVEAAGIARHPAERAEVGNFVSRRFLLGCQADRHQSNSKQ